MVNSRTIVEVMHSNNLRVIENSCFYISLLLKAGVRWILTLDVYIYPAMFMKREGGYERKSRVQK